jgi:betaine-aldehyde dehydrogenase
MASSLPTVEESLPKQKDLWYGGSWNRPSKDEYRETYSPGNGQVVDKIAHAGAEDTVAAIEAAHKSFPSWRATPPQQRAATMRKAASVLREHAAELALLDAYNTGNPVAEMLADANVAAAQMDYFAGLIPMLKGETIPGADDHFHYTIREPLGVVARIVAFNHPVMFAAGKMAAPLAAGNTVVIKPPEQAPLSCLRLAELLENIFPAGVVNIIPGGVECGKVLSAHPLVAKVTLIGSIPTGKAIARAAADTLKSTLFELGGKNALIAFPDADIEKLVVGISRGMNFTWAGQSCGSTSRVFLHESIHDKVLDRVVDYIKTNFKPGVPTEMSTTMGPVISKAAEERVLSYIDSGKKEGAQLLYGGKKPQGDEKIKDGFFIEPTIFTNVTTDMKIAREEIFGPVMSVLKWTDETEMLRQVNSTDYGLTASIYTRDVATAQDIVKKVEAGFIWVNQVGRHYLGVPFGGYKESGGGREESFDEMLSFTQTKTVNISLAR